MAAASNLAYLWVCLAFLCLTHSSSKTEPSPALPEASTDGAGNSPALLLGCPLRPYSSPPEPESYTDEAVSYTGEPESYTEQLESYTDEAESYTELPESYTELPYSSPGEPEKWSDSRFWPENQYFQSASLLLCC